MVSYLSFRDLFKFFGPTKKTGQNTQCACRMIFWHVLRARGSPGKRFRDFSENPPRTDLGPASDPAPESPRGHYGHDRYCYYTGMIVIATGMIVIDLVA